MALIGTIWNTHASELHLPCRAMRWRVLLSLSWLLSEISIGLRSHDAYPPPRTILPLTKWMPHSVFSCPDQRPARASSPGATARVQGAQPIEG